MRKIQISDTVQLGLIALFSVVFNVWGCAAPSVSAEAYPQTEASLQHESPIDAANYEPDASTLLEIALNALKDGEYGASMSAFNRALQTGELSEAGQALAFWYIHLTAKAVEREDDSFEALSSFAVVAHELLEYASDAENVRFAEQFDLARRLSLARALLAARWAQKTAGYGLSLEHPVYVRDGAEKDYFVELVSGCQAGVASQSSTVEENDGAVVERVSLQCDGEGQSTSYFFAYVGAR